MTDYAALTAAAATTNVATLDDMIADAEVYIARLQIARAVFRGCLTNAATWEDAICEVNAAKNALPTSHAGQLSDILADPF